jgi:hypothetical protein
MRRDTSRLAERLANLPALSSDELKDEWGRLYRVPLPKRALRHFLIAAIAYRLQEQALGGLKPATIKLLERVAAGAASGKPVEVTTSPNR